MTKNILLIRLLAVAGIVAVAVTAISYISFKDSDTAAAKSGLYNTTPCGYVTAVTYSTDTTDADKMSTVTVSTSSKGAPCAGAKAMITVYSGNNTILKTAFCDIDKDTCTALGVNQSLAAVGRVDVKLIKSGVSGPNQPASALGQ